MAINGPLDEKHNSNSNTKLMCYFQNQIIKVTVALQLEDNTGFSTKKAPATKRTGGLFG